MLNEYREMIVNQEKFNNFSQILFNEHSLNKEMIKKDIEKIYLKLAKDANVYIQTHDLKPIELDSNSFKKIDFTEFKKELKLMLNAIIKLSDERNSLFD